ncbi:hypothetical protein AB2B38_002130 [Balneola sp. MJW-20]|uniref:hypothetical protein n=1 Tax=Gracilimonas aurantiaca TaxID=3234185 RepID=UPI0034657990
MRRFRSIYSGLILALLAVCSAQSQTLTTYAAQDSVEVGDLIYYSLVLQADKEYMEIIFPDTLSFPPYLEIREKQQFKLSTFKDSLSYSLQNFGTNDLAIPPLEVLLISENDTTILLSDPVNIPYRTVINEETALQALKPLFTFPRIWWPWLLGALLAGGIFWYFWRNRETDPATEKQPTIEIPPFENPLERLEKDLHHYRSQFNFSEPDSFKAYYSGISDAIRRYFEDLYKIPALESTSRELMRYLDVYGIDQEMTELTRSVVMEADLVKFAKYFPDREDALKVFNKALQFLDKAKSADQIRIKQLRTEYNNRYGLNQATEGSDGMG